MIKLKKNFEKINEILSKKKPGSRFSVVNPGPNPGSKSRSREKRRRNVFFEKK